MRSTFIIIFLAICSFSYSQKIDTIIDRQIYKTYISFDLKQPVYVSYKLWKGGGDCSRKGFFFKNDTKLDINDDQEYLHSGYDKGHLANAEDFAYNCKHDELTFRYYNCLPQTPNLNRGIWKTWESIIRKESQKDSLLIITGGIWEGDTGTTVNSMHIPNYCWKVVVNLRTKKVVHSLLFSNLKANSTCVPIPIKKLEAIIKRKII